MVRKRKRRAGPKRFVAYYRVSTDRQGRSGLGLSAQRSAVQEFLNGNGGFEIVAEYTEIESGGKDNRPQLQAALRACRVHEATLVIARLDRLSRDAHFLLGLEKAGVEFVCADMPTANRMTVGIMAMLAEEERRLISRRTKEALAAARARGVRLGNPRNLTPDGRARGSRRGNEAKRRKADARARDLLPLIEEARAAGCRTLKEIGWHLTDRGIAAPRGGRWHPGSVRRVIQRAQKEAKA